MLESFSVLKPVIKWNKRSCESLIFYLNYRMTFLLLIFCCILVSTQLFIGRKINCLSKASVEVNAEFLNDYCWSASTYSVKKAYLKEVGVHVPHPGVEGSGKESEYEYRNFYQYVPIILFIQAVSFYIPHFIWKSVEPNFLSRIPKDVITKKIDMKSTATQDADATDTVPKDIGAKDTEANKKPRIMPNEISTYIEKRWGSHKSLPFKYFMCEILATINVLSQTYALDIFLHGKFLSLGLWFEVYYNSEILSDPIRLFPLVTICTFRRYGPSGYMDVVNALCVLPMNALNAKIFLCLWLWYTILLFLSLCHLTYFLACMVFPVLRILPMKISSWFYKVDIEYDSYVGLILQGNVGDWFVLSSLKRNMDRASFYTVADAILYNTVQKYAI